jgi:hypothetical protein
MRRAKSESVRLAALEQVPDENNLILDNAVPTQREDCSLRPCALRSGCVAGTDALLAARMTLEVKSSDEWQKVNLEFELDCSIETLTAYWAAGWKDK